MSPGPDMISSYFFFNCKFVLAVPLLHLYNLSLSSGRFPTKWKISFAKPIHKGKDLTNIINYRPISIISIIPKLFEFIVYEKIYPILTPLLNEDQHGFLKGKSTTTDFLIFEKYILDVFASGFQVDVIFTDFSKAFDKINHLIICNKLYSIGIHEIVTLSCLG